MTGAARLWLEPIGCPTLASAYARKLCNNKGTPSVFWLLCSGGTEHRIARATELSRGDRVFIYAFDLLNMRPHVWSKYWSAAFPATHAVLVG